MRAEAAGVRELLYWGAKGDRFGRAGCGPLLMQVPLSVLFRRAGTLDVWNRLFRFHGKVAVSLVRTLLG